MGGGHSHRAPVFDENEDGEWELSAVPGRAPGGRRGLDSPPGWVHPDAGALPGEAAAEPAFVHQPHRESGWLPLGTGSSLAHRQPGFRHMAGNFKPAFMNGRSC